MTVNTAAPKIAPRKKLLPPTATMMISRSEKSARNKSALMKLT